MSSLHNVFSGDTVVPSYQSHADPAKRREISCVSGRKAGILCVTKYSGIQKWGDWRINRVKAGVNTLFKWASSGKYIRRYMDSLVTTWE